MKYFKALSKACNNHIALFIQTLKLYLHNFFKYKKLRMKTKQQQQKVKTNIPVFKKNVVDPKVCFHKKKKTLN